MATSRGESGESSSLPLGKYLASSEKKIRDKAIKNLSIFLSDSQHTIFDQDMAKLWKGIFYCFWMSDKPLVQQALAAELAELILTITDTPSSLSFLRGFWTTIVREWNGIDRLRIDKFYMLVRRFVNATFRLLSRSQWNIAYCDQYNHTLSMQGGPLCADDIKVPTSLAYHLADIYLEELAKVLSLSPSPPAPILVLSSPFIDLAAKTPTATTYKRIQSAMFEPLLTAVERHSTDEIMDCTPLSTCVPHLCLSDPSEGPQPPLTLKKYFLKKLFQTAGESTTRDSNRRKMYAFWKNAADDDDNESSDDSG